MRIGIVSDIHDAVVPLREALAALRERGAERIVTLGDAFETFHAGGPGAEVARLLDQVGAVGVWGNHDAGLSGEVENRVRELADPGLLALSTRLRPQLVLGGCRFCHIEPFRDPCRMEDLWAYDGVPDTEARARRSFDAVPERLLFLGHFHQWLIMRGPGGRVDWSGSHPVLLHGPDRYLVVVGAVVDGWCAMLETRTAELTPIRCAG